MRIFNLEERLEHSLSTIQYYFDNEYRYYSEHNKYPFLLDGESVISLYRRLNIQVLVTKRCPFSCPFCVERMNPVGGIAKENCMRQVEVLKDVISAVGKAGLNPTVSFTGGEPMLNPAHVNEMMHLLEENHVMYNVNTSGCLMNASCYPTLMAASRINLSVHESDPIKNGAIFGRAAEEYWNNPIFAANKTTIQKVITTKPDLSSICQFIQAFPQKRFSLRFPTEDENVSSIEWRELFLELQKECHGDIKFIQQKIGDYYWYEEWMIGDKLVHFSFSSLKQLHRNKLNERETIIRALIIEPDGTIKYDWL